MKTPLFKTKEEIKETKLVLVTEEEMFYANKEGEITVFNRRMQVIADRNEYANILYDNALSRIIDGNEIVSFMLPEVIYEMQNREDYIYG